MSGSNTFSFHQYCVYALFALFDAQSNMYVCVWVCVSESILSRVEFDEMALPEKKTAVQPKLEF